MEKFVAAAMLLLFNGSLFYGWLKMKRFPTSISALWKSDVYLTYRFTVIGVSLLSMLFLNPLMVGAGVCLLGLLVFPNIDNKREKMIHDAFAIMTFILMALYVDFRLVLLLSFLAFALAKKLSIYWLEIIGFNIIILTKLLII